MVLFESCAGEASYSIHNILAKEGKHHWLTVLQKGIANLHALSVFSIATG